MDDLEPARVKLRGPDRAEVFRVLSIGESEARAVNDDENERLPLAPARGRHGHCIEDVTLSNMRIREEIVGST